MIVGFWNIQRATNVERDEGVRAGFMFSVLDDWLTRGRAFDILVIAEAAQSGQELVGHLNKRWEKKGYQANYFPVPNVKGAARPCSFMVVWSGTLTNEPTPTGGSTKRPVIIIEAGPLKIGACHIIANRSKAVDEIFTACVEIQAQRPCLVIGDMNYPFEEFNSYEQQTFEQADWSRVAPDMTNTFDGKEVLDYAWRNPGIPTITATPPYKDYDQWEIIDHAPIAYEI